MTAKAVETCPKSQLSAQTFEIETTFYVVTSPGRFELLQGVENWNNSRSFFVIHGGFLSHGGTPSHHLFLDGYFPNSKPTSYWGTPMTP